MVIARLEDGCKYLAFLLLGRGANVLSAWSAPSAIGSAGLGVGGQAGAEMTDFLVVLNSRSVSVFHLVSDCPSDRFVGRRTSSRGQNHFHFASDSRMQRSFMSAGSLTLGGNMSIALGPLGRNGEAIGSLNTSGKMAAMYSYSKTRGLFGGVSVEGSVIVERQDANAQAYHSDVSVKQLLSGSIDPPDWAQPLIKTLEACVGLPGGQRWVDDSANASPGPRGSDYAFGGGVAGPGSDLPPSLRKKKNSVSSPFPPPSWGRRKSGGSYFTSDGAEYENQTDPSPSYETSSRSRSLPENNLVDVDSSTSGFGTRFESDFVPPSPSGAPGHKPAFSVDSRRTPTSNPFSHQRSVSHGAYLTSGNNNASDSFSSSRSTSNPYVSGAKDPFAYETSGETIDDYDVDRDRSRSLLNNKPQFGGIGRAIALYDFNAVQVSHLTLSF